MKLAVAYLRTSSAANVGEDKDSDKRQRAAVAAFARANRFEIVKEFYDAAVSGADPVGERAGFAAMLEYMLGNGARTVLIESPDRFARDLSVQIAGHELLKGHGLDLIPTTSPTFFMEDSATAIMVRNILGAVSQFDRQNVVSRLRRARDRRSETEGGRIEGRKTLAETRPAVVGMVQAMCRRRKRRPSHAKIARTLELLGLQNSKGKPYSVVQVRRMALGPKVKPMKGSVEWLMELTRTGEVTARWGREIPLWAYDMFYDRQNADEMADFFEGRKPVRR
jgi:DNA invertase Pin-like site-specific DNA recombinase